MNKKRLGLLIVAALMALQNFVGEGVLLNSANADFLRQVKDENDVWAKKNAGTLADRNIGGHDVSPTVVDFDGNGVPDFLDGTENRRFYFLKNPRSC